MVDKPDASEIKTGTCGILALRVMEGFSRGMILANTVALFQDYVGLTSNGALQTCKLFGMVTCSTPLAVGTLAEHIGWAKRTVLVTGCAVYLPGILTLAYAIRSHSSWATLFALFIPIGLGLGAVNSVLPVLAAKACLPENKMQFMQTFYMCLVCGSSVGILVGGVAQSLDAYAAGFLVAALSLGVGLTAFLYDASMLAEGNCAEKPPSVPDRHRSSLPLWLLLPFYFAYMQWSSTWYIQAQFMDRTVLGTAPVPPAFTQVFQRLSMLLGMFALRRVGAESASIRARFIVGCVVASAALFVSAFVENMRRNSPRLGDEVDVSSLNIIWLLPQFFLIAIAEAIIFPTQTVWASSSTALVGLGVAVNGVAALLLALALPWLKRWVPDTNPNDGFYDLYFLSMSAMSGIAAFVYAAVPASMFEDGEAPSKELLDARPAE